MASDYKTRLSGDANPNFRSAGAKLCARCGCEYKSYNKDRKYCGAACYSKVAKDVRKPMPRKQLVLKLVKPPPAAKPPRVMRSHEVSCLKCKQRFRAYLSNPRLYCSYPCFVADGGPFRAGLAASKATMKYGARKDANHADIMAVLERLVPIYDTSRVGQGFPDGMALIGGKIQLFDIKNPKTGYGRRGLNPIQKKWVEDWAGTTVYLIYTDEDAVNFAAGKFDLVKSVGGARRAGHCGAGAAMNPEKLLAQAVDVHRAGFSHMSLWIPADWIAPAGFPRREVMCAPSAGGIVVRVNVRRLIAWLRRSFPQP